MKKYLVYVESTVNNGFQFIPCNTYEIAESLQYKINNLGTTLRAQILTID